MNREEFQEFLKDEENRGLFVEAAKGMGFELPEDIEGLKKNNRDLKSEKQKIKSDYEELKKRVDEFEEKSYIDKNDPEEKQLLAKVQRDYDRLKKDYEETQAKSQRIESDYNNSLIDRTISEALEKNGFTQHKSILKQAYLGKAKIETDGDKKSVYIFDGEQELPADEFFKVQADKSLKSYIDKPVNSGAGGSGFTGSNSKAMKLADFKAASPKDRAAFMADGGQILE